MCILHLVENGITVGKERGRIYIKNGTDETSVPLETVDGISVYGKPQLTTQCIEECMRNGIPISFFSSMGGYLGGFAGTKYINVRRQRLQAGFNQTSASFELAKRMIYSKINNQIVLLRRYNRRNNIDIVNNIRNMKN